MLFRARRNSILRAAGHARLETRTLKGY